MAAIRGPLVLGRPCGRVDARAMAAYPRVPAPRHWRGSRARTCRRIRDIPGEDWAGAAGCKRAGQEPFVPDCVPVGRTDQRAARCGCSLLLPHPPRMACWGRRPRLSLRSPRSTAMSSLPSRCPFAPSCLPSLPPARWCARARALTVVSWGAGNPAPELIAGEPQALVVWPAATDEPEIIGEVGLVAPEHAPHRVLTFGAWLEPEAAGAVDSAARPLRS